MNASVPDARRARSRWQLVGLALLFFGPLTAAFVLYYGFPSIRPGRSRAHGTLITPTRPLPEVVLHDAGGRPEPGLFVQKRWSLVYVDAGPCEEGCRDALAAMRVVHALLNADASRVQRVLLYSGAAPDLAALEPGDLHALSLDGEAGARVLAAFPAPAAGRIYIVDPHGNLVMSYPGDSGARQGLLEDLRRLLVYSHIG